MVSMVSDSGQGLAAMPISHGSIVGIGDWLGCLSFSLDLGIPLQSLFILAHAHCFIASAILLTIRTHSGGGTARSEHRCD
jgi:hypothetical protein